MPCQTGGCWACALDIDGRLAPACITPVCQGMRIKMDSGSLIPRRLVGGFMAHRVGIPYNRKLICLGEVEKMGQEIAKVDPWVQVCVLDYRPEFRRLDIVRPTFDEMLRVHETLRAAGLESVVCQTSNGRIGPSGEILP